MSRLIENTEIKKRDPKHRVFSEEPYAQELYDKYCDYFEGKNITSKDMSSGEICKAKIVSITADHILVQADNTQAIYLDFNKEKRFLEKHNAGDNLQTGNVIDVLIEGQDKGSYTGSMEKAFRSSLRKDLMKSLKNKDAAYKVIIKSINDGGFIVDLSGLDCFMPGSLAAANRITDFESMIGKEVYVMVENYLDASDIFVVSNKKYIQSILPDRVKELSFNDQYQGKITGVMSYGAFVEWDSIFTGLLHESEINTTLKELKAGDDVSFWIKEIKEGKDGKDLRIILTQKGASNEHVQLQQFKDQYEGETVSNAVIKDVKPFGIFLELKDGVIGMITPREFKRTGAKPKEGEILDVFVKQVDMASKKIYLRAVEE